MYYICIFCALDLTLLTTNFKLEFVIGLSLANAIVVLRLHVCVAHFTNFITLTGFPYKDAHDNIMLATYVLKKTTRECYWETTSYPPFFSNQVRAGYSRYCGLPGGSTHSGARGDRETGPSAIGANYWVVAFRTVKSEGSRYDWFQRHCGGRPEWVGFSLPVMNLSRVWRQREREPRDCMLGVQSQSHTGLSRRHRWLGVFCCRSKGVGKGLAWVSLSRRKFHFLFFWRCNLSV